MPLVTTRSCPKCDSGCSYCNFTGEVALDPDDRHVQAEFNIKYVVGIVDDIKDKVKDIKEKVDEIMTKLKE